MKRLLLNLALMTTLTTANAQVANQTKDDKLIIYQIFTRLFGNTNSTNAFNGTLAQNGTGKLNDITPRSLQSLKEFGISHVWYTGVIEHATMTDYSSFGIKKDHPSVVKGIAGSPYSIKDYYDINPDLAVDVPNRLQEFDALVERTHQEGLKVIIDFVPNHVARSYYSDKKPDGIEDFGEKDDKNVFFDPNNNFYYLPNTAFEVPKEVNPPVSFTESYIEYPAKATGNDVFSAKPSINDWYEAIKLNYGIHYGENQRRYLKSIPDTWHKMHHILQYWAAKNVDGFRCDMAEMVPVEFWSWVIPKIKSEFPHVIFIAEIYNPAAYRTYLFEGKFDYLYDKVGLYDALRRLMEGGGHAADITRVWQQESGDFGNRMLRFLENHDEQRIASRFFAKDARIGIPAMFLSATLHNGPLMYYFGQELGVNPTQAEGFQGDDGRTTIFDYWGVPEIQAWNNNGQFNDEKLTTEQKDLRQAYLEINEFIKNNSAVRNGHFHDLQYLNHHGLSPNYNEQKIYSYLRYNDEQQLLIVVNFDLSQTYKTVVKLPKGVLKETSETATITQGKQKKGRNKRAWSSLYETGLPVECPPNSYQVFLLK